MYLAKSMNVSTLNHLIQFGILNICLDRWKIPMPNYINNFYDIREKKAHVIKCYMSKRITNEEIDNINLYKQSRYDN